MKICVQGLWHLGSVTAACLAEAGFTVVGLANDADEAAQLSTGKPPLFEPGLEDLLKAGIAKGNLSFTDDIKKAVGNSDIVWVAFDTPVDDDDRADTAYVARQIERLFPALKDGTILLLSSQMPVGSIKQLEARFENVAAGRHVIFACSPENLRLGKALDVFRHPERVVVGLRGEEGRDRLAQLFKPFSDNIIWVGIEAAELSKHAINAFLGTCVTFINEIASVAEKVGADTAEVERALRSEPRIGPKAYISPGAAFAGGTLARDVTFLGEIAARHNLKLPLIDGILSSNRAHADWPLRRLRDKLAQLNGCTVTVLGLSYKPGTDTLRRSLSVKLVEDLARSGVRVTAYDPLISQMPSAPKGVTMARNPAEAMAGADAMVVMTEWPEFKSLKADDVTAAMKTPLVLDQNGFLGHLGQDRRITYLTVGKP